VRHNRCSRGSWWHYLAEVLDLFSRPVAGWTVSDRTDVTSVVKVLDIAVELRGKPPGRRATPTWRVSSIQVGHFVSGCAVTLFDNLGAGTTAVGIVRQ